jgi:hypothetical protein
VKEAKKEIVFEKKRFISEIWQIALERKWFFVKSIKNLRANNRYYEGLG